MEDPMQVNIKTTTNLEAVVLTPPVLLDLMSEYEGFKTTLMQFQHMLLKKNIKFPLDYMPSYEWLNCPKEERQD